MSKSRSSRKQKRLQKKPLPPAGGVLINPAAQEKRLERVFMAVLLAMGTYLSVVYFGQKAVPNPDFPAFVATGNQILHFQMPGSFKRVPLLGILQIAAGQFMFTSPHPVLTGALVLNAVLYTLSILLFYKVARFFITPVGAFCLSLLAAVNPYALVMAVDPIAETAIVFFIMLTLYLILSRSRWCYLAAMLASMVRYECFGLIVIALLFDLFTRKPKRQKLIAIGAAFVVAIPMILWMIGTKVTTTDPQSSYMKHFLNVEHRNGFNLIKMLWMTSFSSLLQWPEYIRAVLVERPTTQQAAQAIKSHQNLFGIVWNSVTAVMFIIGAIGVLLKKQWKYVGVLLFWAGYVCIHMTQSVLIDRYTVPVVWLTLLTAAFGIGTLENLMNSRILRWILMGIKITVAVIAIIWILYLWPAISQTAKVSSASSSVVYVGLLLLAIGLGIKQFVYRGKNAVRDICVFIIVSLLIVSNQFALSFRLGQGDQDIEFKMLADWYLEHAEPGDRMLTSMTYVVRLFIPEYKQCIGPIAGPDETIQEFIETCYKRNIKYVVWDSRQGLNPNDFYYKQGNLQKIAMLRQPRDLGPFKYVDKIVVNGRQYLYIFELEPRSESQHQINQFELKKSVP